VKLLAVAVAYSTCATLAFVVNATPMTWWMPVAFVLVGLALGMAVTARPPELILVVIEVAEDDGVDQFVVPVVLPPGCGEDEKCTAAIMVQNALPLPEGSLATRWRDA
jgi:hypothetical protein